MLAGVLGKAGGQDDRTIDRPDHFHGADAVRIASQSVAAVGSGDRLQHPASSQLLQNLGQQRKRQTVSISHLLGASRNTGLAEGEMTERNQSVVRFFGELEHPGPFQSNIRIARPRVAVKSHLSQVLKLRPKRSVDRVERQGLTKVPVPFVALRSVAAGQGQPLTPVVWYQSERYGGGSGFDRTDLRAPSGK